MAAVASGERTTAGGGHGRHLLILVGCAIAFALAAPSPAAAIDVWEVDDLRTSVPQLTVGTAPFVREIGSAGDLDWFRLSVTAGKSYAIEALETPDSPWFDAYMEVYGQNSLEMIASDDDAGPNLMPKIVLSAHANEVYDIQIRGLSTRSTGGYGIVAREIEPCTITGTVTGVADVGLPFARVTVYAEENSAWSKVAESSTGLDGRFSFKLEAGVYRIGYTSAAGSSEVFWGSADDVGSASDILLVPGQTRDLPAQSLVSWGRVRGTLTGWNDAPLAGISVAAYSLRSGTWSAVAWTSTDGSGSWSMPLADGTYRFGYSDRSGVYLAEFRPDASAVDAAGDVMVSGATLTLADTLSARATVRGSLRDSLTDDPVVGARVDVVKRTGETWSPVATTLTDDGGMYELVAPAGEVAIRASSANLEYCTTYHDGSTLDAAAGSFDLEPGDSQMNLVIERAASVSGRVTSAGTDLSIPGVSVEALLAHGAGELTAVGRSVITGTAGDFTLAGLSPGTYAVRTTLPDGSVTWYVDGQSETTAHDPTLLDLSAGTLVHGIDISVRDDSTPPRTSSGLQGRTLVAPALVRLVASDDRSGVERTLYRVDEGAWASGSTFTLETGGEHTIEYYSIDRAGNAEPPTRETLWVRTLAVTVNTLAGSDRYDTAARISQETFPDGADTAIVVTGSAWADGLGAASLAGAADAPILLVQTDSIPDPTARELKRLAPSRIIVCGGVNAVREAAVSAIRRIAPSAVITRIGGSDRYDTARLIADQTLRLLDSAGTPWDGGYVLASGVSFPDVLAASPIAANRRWPVLLTAPDALCEPTADFLAEHPGGAGLIVGGPNAISDSVASEAKKTSQGTVQRVSGADRYETALALADYALSQGILDFSNMAVASGQDFPDALTCSIRQGKVGSVLLLTSPSQLSAGVNLALADLPADYLGAVTFVGGASAVAPAVRAEVMECLSR